MVKRPQDLVKIGRGRIREFTMTDYEGVAELWQKVGLAARSESTKDIFMEQQRVAKDLFLVYEIDKKVAATVIGGWDGWRAWIYRIAVDPGLQRKGIGSKLIAEITRRLTEKGGKRFRALVVEDNAASRSMFRSMGFSIHGKILLAAKDDE